MDKMFSSEEEVLILDLAELFKVFGDGTRVKILYALSKKGEICVNDLCESLGISQPAVSHHLRILKQAKLVRYSRNGKNLLYSLDDDHVFQIISQGMEHLEE